MPPVRKKSPCTRQVRHLPHYKADARGLPRGSTETLERRRYAHDPKAAVCRVAGDYHAGPTRCYAPTAHSQRRKTCKLLAPDPAWANDFKPGFYLWGTSIFSGEAAQALVCRSFDQIMYDNSTIDSRVEAPPPFSVAVLGPYVHPRTQQLVVKCVPAYVLDEAADNLGALGYIFDTLERDEDGIMVPSIWMLEAFLRFARRSECPYRFTRLREIVAEQKERLAKCAKLGQVVADAPDDLRAVRGILRHYFEAANYFRRWGGPGRPYATNRVFAPVGQGGNPVSPKLNGKVLRNGAAADYVDPVEGRLLYMEQESLNAVLKIYDGLRPSLQTRLQETLLLGTPFRMIDGSGYWLTPRDNYADGNPEAMAINLFSMCYGTNDGRNPRGFVAAVSIQGTRSYCVQVAAFQILRAVLTLLPHLYKSMPAWAKSDGEFTVTHT